jgi:hypothetical protein
MSRKREELESRDWVKKETSTAIFIFFGKMSDVNIDTERIYNPVSNI